MNRINIPTVIFFVLPFLLILPTKNVQAQRSLYYSEKKVTPKIPAKDEKIRVIIVSDVTNEIDDIWAISLAILSPERFDIEGIVTSNHDSYYSGSGPESIQNSFEEAHTILEKAGMEGEIPILRGGHPMQYVFEPSESEGVDFIIERAMTGSSENPLWVIGLGSPTDLASAYLKEPKIKDKVIMYWHARTENTWPFRAHNFNIKGDIRASRIMFHSPLPLVLFDTGTHLSITMEESERKVKPHGDLGEYLHEYRYNSDYFMDPNKGFFDLGDMAALLDPEIATCQESVAPTVTHYMDYNFYDTNGTLLRCSDIDRDKTFQLLYDRLKKYYGLE
ncbi:MAG: nucleoside hydrolase [Balneolaceae bacterium]|nr:nucleoside hydrolase [Balneolaceae bacterium]